MKREVVSVEEILKNEKQKKVKFRIRLQLDELKFVAQCIYNSLKIDDMAKEKGVRFFPLGDLEREVISQCQKRMERSYTQSRRMKIKRIFNGKSVDLEKFGFTFSYPEILVLSRIVCLTRSIDKRCQEALGWNEQERELAEKLWNRLLLVPRRSIGAKKGYLKGFGIKVDWEVPDYREAKWHGLKREAKGEAEESPLNEKEAS